MAKRFTVKQYQEMFLVVDTYANEPVNHYHDYDDAMFDAKCRNEDELQHGDE